MRGILGALVLTLAVVQPAMAQDRAVHLSVRGGGFNGLTSLNEPGTADFKRVGYNVGGSVGVDLSRYLGLQGNFTFARNELEENDIETGAELARFFYDAAVQVRYPTESGWQPYALVGAGAVTLHPVGSSDGDRTTAAGTAGVGVSYTIPGSSLGLLVEGRGWLYEMSELGGSLAEYDRTQFDVTWSAGLSYRLPFGSSAARVAR
ncbi:MAG: outer membrane beta-barrel protein [Longimicrobiales bacterium]